MSSFDGYILKGGNYLKFDTSTIMYQTMYCESINELGGVSDTF